MTDSVEGGKGTWLPNLVGGVSIWKLAPDLNQAHLFDGRLLEPEVEGSESLPTRVVWHVERLVPLAEARAAHGADVDAAVHEFLAAVERVGKELASPASGFRKFRDAFSVPSLEGEGAASYFYDPASKKVRVANWGASPRTIAGHGELVFGYEKFDRFAEGARAALGGAAVGGAAVGGAAVGGAEALAAMGPPVADVPGADPAQSPQVTGADAEEAAKQKAAEDEAKKKDEAATRKPLWVWILAVVVGVAAVVALLLLLKHCQEPEVPPGADGDAGADAGADAAADADAGDADAGDAGDVDAGDADADAGDAGDADADAGDADADADAGDADAGDAGADADAGDAGADADADGGAGPGTGSGPGKVGGDGTGFGVIFHVPGGSGPGTAGPPAAAQGIPFRSHFQPGATRWRITTGASHLHRSLKPRMNGGSFEVFLEPGASFSEVQVEWLDAGGAWHIH